MDEKEKLKIIEEMQKVAAQMKADDIEENPDSETETFDCSCCGATKPYAGSIQYGKHRLCNDCVLIAETGFALKRLKNIDDLIEKMEDSRMEEICDFIKKDEQSHNN
ncbi:MAG: hypothetical protein PHV37_02180 [Candidatus Gastranaerophilales bacterium]|nr:hypothetical protein [Candidatus Gastranaerophilales bacterium]